MLANNEVLAMGLVTNILGEFVSGHRATVTHKNTDSTIVVQTEKGALSFLGKRGEAYTISVEHDDYETAQQQLRIPLKGPETEKFTVILKNKSEGVDSKLLVVDTEEGTSKMFITSGESLNEIKEKDSVLYIQTPRGDAYLGKGNISNLRKDPSSVLKELGMQKSGRSNLRNIYFEFDKANLDDKDKVYLEELVKILDHDRSLKLLIAGHADDRGDEDYNIRLSRRRVLVVTKFLITNGIHKERIIQKAYGESLPVIPCYLVDCSEDDHQKNRRAEFVLRYETQNVTAPPLSKKTVTEESNNQR
jgi:outer membrane protein OmpA-like peptidoglycan-associated protein